MGGGGSLGNIGRGALGAVTGGASEVFQKNPFGGGIPGRALSAGITGGLSEFGQRNPFGVPINNPYAIFGKKADGTPSIAGPFELNQAQFEGDRSAINAEGQKQYTDTLSAIDENTAAQAKRAADLFKSTLPNIAEDAQAAHLYDSSGYGQEVARQQAELASKVASDAANAKLSALSGRQGFETGALQRGLSLEDFINQANVAKTIGAQMAPQPPSGKQNFGTVAQGVGALYPAARAIAK